MRETVDIAGNRRIKNLVKKKEMKKYSFGLLLLPSEPCQHGYTVGGKRTRERQENTMPFCFFFEFVLPQLPWNLSIPSMMRDFHALPFWIHFASNLRHSAPSLQRFWSDPRLEGVGPCNQNQKMRSQSDSPQFFQRLIGFLLYFQTGVLKEHVGWSKIFHFVFHFVIEKFLILCAFMCVS